MRQLRNYFILTILIVCALIGGTKYLLWYYTDQIARHIQSITPPGVFSYNGISTSLQGKSSIDDIVLSVDGNIIHIKQLELESNGFFSFLSIFISKNKLPDELTLNFKEIDISSALFFANKKDQEYFSNCRVTRHDYLTMGYDRIIIDAKISYKKTLDDNIQFNYYIDAKNVSTISGDFLGSIYPTSPEEIIAPENLPIFHINISNNKLQQSIHELCAKKAKLSLDDYLKQLTLEKTRNSVDLVTTTYFNLVLDDEVIQQLNQYERKPLSLDLSLRPKTAIRIKELQSMLPTDVVKLINLSLTINGKGVPIDFTWMSTEEMIESKKPAPVYKPAVIKSAERMLTPINELNKKAFNKRIEVRLRSGRVYKGIFTKVEGNLLHMLVINEAGTSQLTLHVDSIQLAYILSDY